MSAWKASHETCCVARVRAIAVARYHTDSYAARHVLAKLLREELAAPARPRAAGEKGGKEKGVAI